MAKRGVMEWLGFPGREHTSRDLLGWLIEADGAGVLGQLFGVDCGELESVEAEHRLGTGSQIDLHVVTATHVIGIEVKVQSGVHGDQLFRYARFLREAALKAGKQALLAFVTETGLAPDYPVEFERITGVPILVRTWDELLIPVPANPLEVPFADAWRSALEAHRLAIRQYENALLSDTQLDSDGIPPWRRKNLWARALLTLAQRVAGQTGVPIVMTPHEGANGDSLQVDLSRPAWTVPLGEIPEPLVAELAQISPFADGRLRFSLRIRFYLDGNHRVSLRLGSTSVPYLNFIPKKDRRPIFEALEQPLLRAFRVRLAIAAALAEARLPLASASPLTDNVWECHHHLIRAPWTSTCGRVDEAAAAVARIAPLVDRITGDETER